LQKLKAACNEAIGVLVAATGQTSAIWERLQAAVVVAPSMQDDTAVGQYDISYQLAEIEVRILIIFQKYIFQRKQNRRIVSEDPIEVMILINQCGLGQQASGVCNAGQLGSVPIGVSCTRNVHPMVDM